MAQGEGRPNMPGTRPGKPGMPPEAMTDDRIAVDQIDTVCTECFYVTEGRYSITCPICGGVPIYTQKGHGKQAMQDLKTRGTTNLNI